MDSSKVLMLGALGVGGYLAWQWYNNQLAAAPTLGGTLPPPATLDSTPAAAAPAAEDSTPATSWLAAIPMWAWLAGAAVAVWFEMKGENG